MKTIIITGANGFIGSSLMKYLQRSGFETLGWAREPMAQEKCYPFDLNRISGISWPDKADVLIHCAWIYFSQDPQSDKKNLEAVECLHSECKKRKIKFIFLSSFSAHAQAISHYGRTKYKAETMLDLSLNTILKPGLVLGNGGLFQRIMNLNKSSRFLPLPGSGKQLIQTIWIEDLCKIIVQLLHTPQTGIIALAHHQPISLHEFYKQILHVSDKTSLIIPLPFQLLLWMSTLIKALGIKSPIDNENILGLKHSVIIDTHEISKRYSLLSTSQTLEKITKKADLVGQL